MNVSEPSELRPEFYDVPLKKLETFLNGSKAENFSKVSLTKRRFEISNASSCERKNISNASHRWNRWIHRLSKTSEWKKSVLFGMFGCFSLCFSSRNEKLRKLLRKAADGLRLKLLLWKDSSGWIKNKSQFSIIFCRRKQFNKSRLTCSQTLFFVIFGWTLQFRLQWTY